MQPIHFLNLNGCRLSSNFDELIQNIIFTQQFNQTLNFGTDQLILKSKVKNICSQFISSNQMDADSPQILFFHPKHQFHSPFNQTLHFGTDQLMPTEEQFKKISSQFSSLSLNGCRLSSNFDEFIQNINFTHHLIKHFILELINL